MSPNLHTHTCLLSTLSFPGTQQVSNHIRHLQPPPATLDTHTCAHGNQSGRPASPTSCVGTTVLRGSSWTLFHFLSLLLQCLLLPGRRITYTLGLVPLHSPIILPCGRGCCYCTFLGGLTSGPSLVSLFSCASWTWPRCVVSATVIRPCRRASVPLGRSPGPCSGPRALGSLAPLCLSCHLLSGSPGILPLHPHQVPPLSEPGLFFSASGHVFTRWLPQCCSASSLPSTPPTSWFLPSPML